MNTNLFIFTDSMDHFIQADVDYARRDMDWTECAGVEMKEHRFTEDETPLRSNEKKLAVAKKKTLALNMLIIALCSIGAGWLGILLKNLTERAEIGLLVFLVIPPLSVLISQSFGKSFRVSIGIKPKIKRNIPGYTLAVLFFPALIAVVVFSGNLAGVISINNLLDYGFGRFVYSVLIMFASDFIKNCLEEFTWRGYFTKRFRSLGVSDLVNHLLTGLVWTLWHLPYWLFLLDRSLLATFSSMNISLFILMSSLFLMANSILFGEIRLLTRTTWPVVILHTSLNAVTTTIMLKQLVMVAPSAEIWMSPGGNSLMVILLVTLTGLVLFAIRKKKNTVRQH